MRQNDYIDCQCQSPDHVIRFTLDDYANEEPELYVEVQLHQWHSFWKRLVLAVKYLFGKSARFGYWDCTLLDTDSAQKLAVMCHQYRAKRENYARAQASNSDAQRPEHA